METKYCNMILTFANKADAFASFADLKDEVHIDCGDFSEERLTAVLAETTHKITQAWRYMAGRNPSAAEQAK